MNTDQAIQDFDRILRTLFASAHSARPVPGADLPDATLSDTEKRHVAALMRINHCGEICAQALYQGQSITSSDPQIASALRHASDEEVEHLAWTEQRLAELGGRKSLLNPLWYAGAFAMGAVAGRIGEDWNLGFLAETERQVEAHLSGHLDRLPAADSKSRAILEQMKIDEVRHGQTAIDLGARGLPAPIKLAMKLASRVMTGTAYWI